MGSDDIGIGALPCASAAALDNARAYEASFHGVAERR
jgi:hypothetical protein